MHRRALPLIVLFLAACSQTPPPQPQPEVGANAAPVVELAASSLEGEAEFGVNFLASASDPEGDALSYRWTVNGEALEQAASTLGLTFYAAGRYRVEVSVSDGVNTVTEALTVTARDELRPADAPDVVILGFAGRCGLVCGAPANNQAYLSDEARTLPALEAAFESLGYSTRSYSYAATVARSENNYGHPGYWEAQLELDRIYQAWVAGFKNPTRIVLVGHSNGTVWASLLAMENPHVTFDYEVSLDGVCNHWEEDNLRYGALSNTNLIAEFYTRMGTPYPKTLALLGGACNAYPVPGLGYQHLKDVVPWNVRVGVELHSDAPAVLLPDSVESAPIETQGKCFAGEWTGVKDRHTNLRPDGSTDGLYLYQSNSQDHCELTERDERAVQSLVDFIKANGLP